MVAILWSESTSSPLASDLEKFSLLMMLSSRLAECQRQESRRHSSAHFPRYPFCLENPLWLAVYLADAELQNRTPRAATSIWPASLSVPVFPPGTITLRKFSS